MPNEKSQLPKGWEWKKLGEVSHIIMGQSPPGSSYNQNGNGLPLLQGPSDLRDNKKRYTSEPKKICKEGDILIAVRATVGELFWSNDTYAVGRGLAAIRSNNENVQKDYIYYYLLIQSDKLMNKGTGSTFKAIRKSDLKNLELPIPPLPVQKQIVENLDALMASIENAKNLHKQSVDLTNILMQAAIQYEFERAEEEGWEWKKLGEVVETKYGISRAMNDDQKGYPAIRMNNLTYDGRLELSDVKYVELSEEEFNRYKLRKSDILFNRTNSRELVGKTALYNIDGDHVPVSYLIRVRLVDENVLAEYIVYYLNSSRMKNYFFDIAKPAIAQSNINSNQLKFIEIPVPSLPVQKQIVEKLDGFREMVDSLRQQQKERSEWLEKLPKALLEKAFKGELGGVRYTS